MRTNFLKQFGNKKGFSLVELLVAMAIIAVLIAIAAYGIGIVQRNSRNTQRRKHVENMILLMTDTEANNVGATVNTATLAGSTFTVTGTNVPANITYTVSGFTPSVALGCPDLSDPDEISQSEGSFCVIVGETFGVYLEGTTRPFTLDW